jgi:hypothetical protein
MSKASALRNTGKRAIVEALEKSSFSRHNFEVMFDGLKDASALVLITFAPRKEFCFQISKSANYPREPGYFTQECPGHELNEDTRYDRKDFEECIAALIEWVKRIVEDCRQASPLYDDFQAFRESVMEELSRHFQEAHLQAPAPAGDKFQAKLEALAMKVESLEALVATQARQIQELKVQRASRPELDPPKKTTNGSSQDAWFTPIGTKVVE